jgi:hypothetical protein
LRFPVERCIQRYAILFHSLLKPWAAAFEINAVIRGWAETMQ